jgi:hypothetical protein
MQRNSLQIVIYFKKHMMKTINEQEHNKSKYALETYEYHLTFKTLMLKEIDKSMIPCMSNFVVVLDIIWMMAFNNNGRITKDK